MLAIAPGWELKVDRGPDGLWVSISGPAAENPAESSGNPPLAEQLWSLLERHFVHRLVLELENVEVLDERLMEQLLVLNRRIREHGGMMRLCGLSPENQDLLKAYGAHHGFAVYDSLEDAVMGEKKVRKPR